MRLCLTAQEARWANADGPEFDLSLPRVNPRCAHARTGHIEKFAAVWSTHNILLGRVLGEGRVVLPARGKRGDYATGSDAAGRPMPLVERCFGIGRVV